MFDQAAAGELPALLAERFAAAPAGVWVTRVTAAGLSAQVARRAIVDEIGWGARFSQLHVTGLGPRADHLGLLCRQLRPAG